MVKSAGAAQASRTRALAGEPRPARGDGSKSAQTRERIIFAAAKVFRKKGYARSTLADIAAAANTQAGSLYYHFASREHIVRALLERSAEATESFVRGEVAKAGEGVEPIERLRIALRAHVLYVLKMDDFIMAFNRIIDQVPPKVQRDYVLLPRPYARFLASLIDDAVAAGQIRGDVSPTMARLAMFGAVNWMVNWWKRSGPNSAEEVAEEFTQIFFGGLLPRPQAG